MTSRICSRTRPDARISCTAGRGTPPTLPCLPRLADDFIVTNDSVSMIAETVDLMKLSMSSRCRAAKSAA